ncbi:hypothetical protein pdul_cds_642 [Pandoravirus dulcis]|uniref:Ankyrin repeat domain containing protein n=1 Tax=Pandoravirus dulcis TaxID=1349409 RepID=S4VTM9_9VIRU|nr:hypothetical protein pdul_cds_642 [Pandoravirus dulcis]AGO82780.1 hypothetical protein pdul_cds_642 [Pandoravirus dulcis]
MTTTMMSGAGMHAAAAAWVGARGLQLDTCAQAAAEGRHDAILWLRLAGCPWDATACTAAAAAGRLNTLKFLRSGDEALGGAPCPWDETTCAAAAATGLIEVIAWLRDGDDPCPWDARALAAAATQGHFKMIYWLCGMRWGAARVPKPQPYAEATWRAWRQRHRCPSDPTVFAAAAATGRVAVMVALYARGVPMDAAACAAAASNGHLDALVWLRRLCPPCPWDERTTKGAASAGHRECLAMALAGGCPAPATDDLRPAAPIAAAVATSDSSAMPSPCIVLPTSGGDAAKNPMSSTTTPMTDSSRATPPATLVSVTASWTDACAPPETIQHAPLSPTTVAVGVMSPVRCDWADQGDHLDEHTREEQETDRRSPRGSRKHDPREAPQPQRHRSGAKERAKRERRAQAAKAAAAAVTPAPAATANGIAIDRRPPSPASAAAVVRPEFSFAAAVAAAASKTAPVSYPRPAREVPPTLPETRKSPLATAAAAEGSPKVRRRKRGGKGRR